MSDPGARTLRLLSLLQSRRYWPGPDLAGRLGVSVRTLRRDVDRLRGLGYPVAASRGVDGGYALAPGTALPPLLLDDDEAVALVLGLQAVADAPVAGMAETSVRALATVVQVLPARLRRRVEALRAMTVPGGWAGPSRDVVDPAVLTAVALACRDTERTVFGYTPPGRERTERTVEPHRLVALGRRWYLVGYDLDRGDWRVFRVDRLDAPRGTGAVFGPRRFPAEDAAAYVRERIGSAWTRHVVEATVAAPADRVRRRIGRWATVTEDGDGCRVRIEGDDLDWAALALGVTGAPFTVLSPPEVVAHLRVLAERFAAAADAAVR
ncbi:Predicted DNA-binding transcriptional regulator YafY, contains an HTH and WYL domains [Geodermatophilus telluris]|uniref:Predicted DNA-binding transcriptional regulator YafY, contains an HTH and WYL domains n=1 Tax=Geodermatophilus telluris TaxID=1190417 RepID=A0A1G6PKR9_9ACTN|nr:YafY family protein [Geodermatophilus telluris]SDC80184.1 Predicted DNA-binding transcriptional regulator YafY, contains an HTH and WYL domains [Geodermatophilus telluris]